MIEKLRITILAEDKRHQSFALRYLKTLGCSSHKIRREALPNGAGAGEQWVRVRYAQSVFEIRRRSENMALLVVIDADTVEVARRRSQLEEGPQPMRLKIAGEIGTSRIELDRLLESSSVWSRPNAAIPEHCVPSLLDAIPEARRLEQ